MSDIKFYEKVSEDVGNNKSYLELKKVLREKTSEINGTIYVLQSPLYSVEEDKSTEIKANKVDSFVILIPRTKIIFTSINDNQEDEFEDYIDEFVDSITTLSGVFGFKRKIGNSRKWRQLIENMDISSITKTSLGNLEISDKDALSILEILISLITGSINTADRGGRIETILDAVKKRIVQFDGDQTRFVYDDIDKKEVSIQGLAGTGKTELLFHRLVNLYNQTDKKIVFTCNSKILANDIKNRIPKFFDQMKVSKREDIDDRIIVMRSWGSHYNPNSGLYSYICSFYGINFTNYGDSGLDGFDGVCKNAIKELEKIKETSEFEFCFDYILIDEAQDFSDSFFRLCEMVSSEQVIIASDIFQKIYDRKSEIVKQPDFTLNKVYRTDPKNFMFAQFLGFGLREKPVIQWFDNDDSWRASGYSFEKEESTNPVIYEFYRDPINRFNDFDCDISPTELIYTEDNSQILDKITEIIVNLQAEHSDLKPSDIGIVFVSRNNSGYRLADMISNMIEQKYGWESQKVYESRHKSRQTNKVFISNQNNVKGLEFPFIIGIVLDEITQDLEIRNTIYMLMTRSFLTSYLILGESNEVIYNEYLPMLNEIKESGRVKINKPSKSDILQDEQIQNLIGGSLTFDQKIERALRNKNLFNQNNAMAVRSLISTLFKNQVVSVAQIEFVIEKNRDFLDD
ncbi:DEAD/DEAH box helicase [Streptococcus salivarius]|uniref:DEAD/DEAH box helicase n=1 Tax=Streptococcus salivarius TaxID=1304 RepID=UPI0022E35ADA|nr:DEAD/DEAH box helicase family protein [Streptococcus salivarius]